MNSRRFMSNMAPPPSRLLAPLGMTMTISQGRTHCSRLWTINLPQRALGIVQVFQC
jgi:hypothetical protein